MLEAIESYEHAGVPVEIFIEPEPEIGNPRDDDNLGIMYCWHPEYILGDEQFSRGDHESLDDARIYLFNERGAIAVLPLFLLDHSGLSMSCRPSPFDYGGWDTTMCGFIFTTAKRANELGLAANNQNELIQQLYSEVEEYNKFLRGEVFAIAAGERDSSFYEVVSGFLGLDFARENANMFAEDIAKRLEREKRERTDAAARDITTT